MTPEERMAVAREVLKAALRGKWKFRGDMAALVLRERNRMVCLASVREDGDVWKWSGLRPNSGESPSREAAMSEAEDAIIDALLGEWGERR